MKQHPAVVEAMTWLGTPWHHAARVKGAGVDCAMLLCEVYERAGMIPRTEPEPYPMDWHLHRGEERFLGLVEKYGTRVDGDPMPGDVVLYKYGRCISHGAIVIDWPGSILHAYLLLGKVVMTGAEDGDLRGRFAGAWRIAP